MEGSRLGTQAHWDGVYERECLNFVSSQGDDGGDDWFSENIGGRLVDWICDRVETWVSVADIDVLDLGSGNGAWLLEIEAERRWGRLVGVDYSAAAVELATKAAAHRDSKAQFRVDDIRCLKERNFHLVHDKGTYDAFMLAEGADRRDYASAILKTLVPSGCFVITSCNHTADELQRDLQAATHGRLQLIDQLMYPTFRFGGAEGAAVTTLAFLLTAEKSP